MQEETADIAAVTCGLLDNMVTVCGEGWRQCHDLAQVIIISTLLHETLLHVTRAAGGEDAGHVRGVPGGQEQRRHGGHRAVREHHQVQVLLYIVCRTS